MEYQLLTFGGLLINVWGPTWDWTAHIISQVINLGSINLDKFYRINTFHMDDIYGQHTLCQLLTICMQFASNPHF